MSISFEKLELLSSGQTTLRGASFLILSGFPPFLLFWIKASVFVVLTRRRVYLAFVIIFSSVVRLFIYFRILCLSLELREKGNRKLIPVLVISLLVGFFY
jgi:NADH:ubiquinone oxidoreductase subunit 2 (subunit N)